MTEDKGSSPRKYNNTPVENKKQYKLNKKNRPITISLIVIFTISFIFIGLYSCFWAKDVSSWLTALFLVLHVLLIIVLILALYNRILPEGISKWIGKLPFFGDKSQGAVNDLNKETGG